MGMDGRYRDYRSCEQTLNRIRGVDRAQIAVEDGRLDQIHVLTTGERDIKRVVRDIQSALFTCHDIHLKADQIKVIAGKESLDMDRKQKRARIVGLNYHLSQGWGRAGVQLDFHAEEFFGMAEGPSTVGNRLRLFVEATLKAVESCLGDQVMFTAEHVSIIEMGTEQAILVAVSLVGMESEEILTGSCVVRGDEWEAVVKATLDALNRRFNSI